jgi:hypothetical protein
MRLGVHLQPEVLPLLLRTHYSLSLHGCREGFSGSADFAVYDGIFSRFDIRDAPGDEVLADEVDYPADFADFWHRSDLRLSCCLGYLIVVW